MSNLSPDFILPENFCANPQEAWTIPARFYTDQNAFEHEKENVFAKSWICVAHSSELANANDYVTREIIGESIVLVRGRDKVLRAFYNVCPSRYERTQGSFCTAAAGEAGASLLLWHQ